MNRVTRFAREASRFVGIGFAAAALVLLASAPAFAQAPGKDKEKDKEAVTSKQDTVYFTMTPEMLSNILRGMGFEFTLKPIPTKEGKTINAFQFELIGYKAVLLLFSNSRSISMTAGFAMKDKPSLKRINKWNSEKRFSRAYLDEDDDPRLESDLDFDGGATQDSVKEFIRTFRASLSAFATEIGM